MPKKIDSSTDVQRKESSLLFGRVSQENVLFKNLGELIRPPTSTPKKTPKGSEMQPWTNGHRRNPVPIPSKQEDVKTNRYLGDMSAVKTVTEKKRKDACIKINEGNSVYVLKSPD
jgi:hypothetical protein